MLGCAPAILSQGFALTAQTHPAGGSEAWTAKSGPYVLWGASSVPGGTSIGAAGLDMFTNEWSGQSSTSARVEGGERYVVEHSTNGDARVGPNRTLLTLTAPEPIDGVLEVRCDARITLMALSLAKWSYGVDVGAG